MRRIVLIGGGHAHLGVLRGVAALVRRGVEVVVVSPGDFWYSGLATGVLAGQYPAALDVVALDPLAARVGARVVRDMAVAIDPAAGRVVLASGERLAYDALSLDVGSEVPLDAVPGAAAHALPVKPVANLARLRDELEARWRAGKRVRLLVVGGGASGCEVAATAERLAARTGAGLDVVLLASSSRLAPGLPPRAAQRLETLLPRRHIRCAIGVGVTAIDAGEVHTTTGDRVSYDLLVLATGLVPPPLLRTSGLPTDAAGALLVDINLRAVGDPRVFGGGDCVTFAPQPLPKVGVHAVRQAPILLHNLAATLDGRPLRPYVPRRRTLLILNLGDGTGLATWGPFAWHGAAAFRLKDRIDRRWLAASRA